MPRTRLRSSDSAVDDDALASAISCAAASGSRVMSSSREPEVHPQRHQPGLRAVVQVAFDTPQLGGRVVDAGGAGGLQLPDALVQFLLAGGSDQHPGDGRLHPHQQRGAPVADRQDRERDERGDVQREAQRLDLEQPDHVAPGRRVGQPHAQADEDTTGVDRAAVRRRDRRAQDPAVQPSVQVGVAAQHGQDHQQHREPDPHDDQGERRDQQPEDQPAVHGEQHLQRRVAEHRPAAGRRRGRDGDRLVRAVGRGRADRVRPRADGVRPRADRVGLRRAGSPLHPRPSGPAGQWGFPYPDLDPARRTREVARRPTQRRVPDQPAAAQSSRSSVSLVVTISSAGMPAWVARSQPRLTNSRCPGECASVSRANQQPSVRARSIRSPGGPAARGGS